MLLQTLAALPVTEWSGGAMAVGRHTGPVARDRPNPPGGVDRLLVQVARGNRDAFAAVYDQVAGPVYGLVHRMVGDPARSEHVTGDVLTEVWRTASKFSPADGSGISWIMTIARRRAVGAIRKPPGRRARRTDLDQIVKDLSERAGLDRPGTPEAGPPDGPGNPKAGLPDEAAGLATLPEPQRQALVLVCYGGYGQGQAAALLGVPAGTVAGWIRDGLPLLAASAS
jgi:RNA polymerase sigma-70 factor (ECF subfamily)